MAGGPPKDQEIDTRHNIVMLCLQKLCSQKFPFKVQTRTNKNKHQITMQSGKTNLCLYFHADYALIATSPS